MAKQHQHRPATRAPHGKPNYSKRVGAWVTTRQHSWTRRRGGSAYIRRLIEQDMAGGGR